MNNRWCIIGGPRSGSRWLEDSIWAYFFNNNRFAQRLSEVIHPLVGNLCQVIVGNSGCLSLKDNKDAVEAPDFGKFLKQQTDLILQGDINQPLTMRVFCQTWHYTNEEYLDFFKKMQTHGFNFISLERNLFDRALSWYIMDMTSVQHKLVNKDTVVYTTLSGDRQPHLGLDNITVDVEKFLEFYTLCGIDDQTRKDIEYFLPVKSVTYENLIQDCNRQNIPIANNVAITKLYESGYKDKIKNYQDLVEAVSQLTEKEIYE